MSVTELNAAAAREINRGIAEIAREVNRGIAEIDRLRAVNAALVSACKAALYAVEGSSLDFLDTGHDLALGDELRAALALAGEA